VWERVPLLAEAAEVAVSREREPLSRNHALFWNLNRLNMHTQVPIGDQQDAQHHTCTHLLLFSVASESRRSQLVRVGVGEQRASPPGDKRGALEKRGA